MPVTVEQVNNWIGALGEGLSQHPNSYVSGAGDAINLYSGAGSVLADAANGQGSFGQQLGSILSGFLGSTAMTALAFGWMASHPMIALGVGALFTVNAPLAVLGLGAIAFATGALGGVVGEAAFDAASAAHGALSGMGMFAPGGLFGPPSNGDATTPPDGLPDAAPGFGDPLVLDLSGSGINLTSARDSSAHFDFDGNGFAVRTGWITEGSGLLVLDDGSNDGAVKSAELLGALSGNSFADLAALDANGDGVIDSSDAAYSHLRVWVDAGLDGVSSSGELYSLSDLGITSINVNSSGVNEWLNGNLVVSRATFTRTPPEGGDPVTSTIAEVVFGVDRQISEFTPPAGFELAPGAVLLPELVGYGMLPDLSVALSLNSDLLVAAKALVLGGGAMSHSDFDAAFQALIFEWAGATDINPGSRGSYIDARHLAVIYAYYGIDQVADPQYAQNPNWHNGPAVWEPLYRDIINQFQTRFVSQISSAQLLNGVSLAEIHGSPYYAFAELQFSAVRDRMDGDFGDLFRAISDAEPAGATEAAAYWEKVLPIVKALRTEFSSHKEFVTAIGVGAAAANLSPALHNGLFGPLGIVLVVGDAGANNLVGGGLAEFISGGLGDDALAGGGSDDTYVYRRGDGNDTITEYNFSGDADKLVFTDIDPADVLLVRDGDSVTLTIAESRPGKGDGGSIKLVNSLDGSFGTGVDRVVFANGTAWSRSDIRVALLAQVSTSGNDVITGFGSNDTITGGAGDDALTGDYGNDTYVYARGDGNDTIYEYGSGGDADKLMFSDIDPADVLLVRDGDSVTIMIAESSPGAGDGGSIKLVNSLTGALWKGVDQVAFADGTTWTQSDIRVALLAQAATSGNDAITGFGSNDTITGGAGDDALAGDYGNDTYVYARGDGNDTITEGSSGGDTDKLMFTNIDPADVSLVRDGDSVTLMIAESSPGAGDGGSIKLVNSLNGALWTGVDQVVFADGTIWTQATLRTMLISGAGTDGNDNISGTDASDIISGAKGDDTISGARGDDTYVYARGDGNDTITEGNFGGDADKVVFTNIDPADVSLVRDGDSVTLIIAESSPGAGDSGSVKLLNSLNGSFGTGVDQVVFANGTIWTRSDIRVALLAQASTTGNDVITGFSSSDVVTGGVGDDTLFGGGSDDSYFYARGDGNDAITEGNFGGDADKVVFTDIDPADVLLVRDGDSVILIIAESSPGAGDSGSIKLVNSLSGSFGTGVDQVVFANGTIWTRAELRAHSLELIGTSGDDALDGTGVGEILSGLEGNDTINAGAGNDILIGGAGADVLNGGDGFDIASYATSNTGIFIHTGNLSSNTGDAAGDTAIGIEGIRGSAFDDEMILIEDGITVWGGGGDDTLTFVGQNVVAYGEDGNDVIYGGAGVDTVYGGAGNDEVQSYEGADQIYLGDGDDYAVAGTGADLIDGGDGVDVIHAGSGNDTILGGAGNDQLHADDGDDLLEGDTGNDWLVGGAGNDKFVFRAMSGEDGIADFEVHGGTSEGDLIELHGQSASTFAELMLNATEWDGTSYINLDGGHNITLHGVTLAELSAADFRFA